jgi:phage tail-like protein
MPGTRTAAAGRFALELDGVVCGFVQSVSGGAISADVIETRGAGPFAEKHLGRVGYEEITVTLGLSSDQSVYDWISATLTGRAPRRDGSIVATDYNLKAMTEVEFFRGLITEVGFPACDASSKDPAYMTIKISPEYTRYKKGSGKTLKATLGRQREWQPSAFKLEIDGLDSSKVSKIDALTVEQTAATDQVGDSRDYAPEPANIEFPNLCVTLPASSADSWSAWFDDFVVKGNDDESKERNGKLTYLSTDLKTTLGELSFFDLGIFRLEQGPRTATAETVAVVLADLYCERMELAVP